MSAKQNHNLTDKIMRFLGVDIYLHTPEEKEFICKNHIKIP